jgi:uncharacterized protein with PQ loop repeat
MKICDNKNCMSEYIGMVGITISILYYIIQFTYTTETLDVSSFSIYAIILGIISELLYCIQGIYKNSPTIIFTRFITTIGFTYLLIIWLYDKYNKRLKRNKRIR